MNLSTFDSLMIAINFLVPGFIFHFFLSLFIPVREEESQLSLIKYLTISCLNFVLWLWLVIMINTVPYFTKSILNTTAAWFVILGVSPAFFGIVTAQLHRRNIFREAIAKFGLFAMHIIPTAWDYKFSKTLHPTFVLVTLKDGSQIAGCYGGNSFASTGGAVRDIYLEKLYHFDDDGPWRENEDSRGMLINGEQICAIEFK